MRVLELMRYLIRCLSYNLNKLYKSIENQWVILYGFQ